MGLGHVPQEPFRPKGADPEFQGRQRRGIAPRGSERHRLSRSELALIGENRAAQWYSNEGYVIVARNWRCRAGEIDIIATRHDVVVISEVKCRTSDYFGAPSLAVDANKQKRLRRLAAIWLSESPRCPRSVRFDVVEVLVVDDEIRLNVIESAF